MQCWTDFSENATEQEEQEVVGLNDAQFTFFDLPSGNYRPMNIKEVRYEAMIRTKLVRTDDKQQYPAMLLVHDLTSEIWD